MIKTHTKDQLLWYQNPQWQDIPHGFFTRRGGSSKGLYRGLNCGLGSDDLRDDVLANQQRVMDALAPARAAELCCQTLFQYHSTDVWVMPCEADDAPLQQGKIKGDAMVAHYQGADSQRGFLAIMTADCAPILFYDESAQIVGAAHAGWKGALSGVIENTVLQMQQLGAGIDSISAMIGPTIAQKSYEVGAEFYQHFCKQGGRECEAFFAPASKAEKYQFDLGGFIRMRLIGLGITQERIACAHLDTYDGDFFSYRRSCHRQEPDYGRNISLIAF